MRVHVGLKTHHLRKVTRDNCEHSGWPSHCSKLQRVGKDVTKFIVERAHTERQRLTHANGASHWQWTERWAVARQPYHTHTSQSGITLLQRSVFLRHVHLDDLIMILLNVQWIFFLSSNFGRCNYVGVVLLFADINWLTSSVIIHCCCFVSYHSFKNTKIAKPAAFDCSQVSLYSTLTTSSVSIKHKTKKKQLLSLIFLKMI